MGQGQDPKYGQVSFESTDHSPLENDEPVFVLRGKDKLALLTIDDYSKRAEAAGCPPVHLANIMTARQRFEDFQQTHPDRVRLPD